MKPLLPTHPSVDIYHSAHGKAGYKPTSRFVMVREISVKGFFMYPVQNGPFKKDKVDKIVERVGSLERMSDARDLIPLLAA